MAKCPKTLGHRRGPHHLWNAVAWVEQNFCARSCVRQLLAEHCLLPRLQLQVSQESQSLFDCVPEVVLDTIAGFFGEVEILASFMLVGRQWFSVGMRHPSLFKEPFTAWEHSASQKLDEELTKLHQPLVDFDLLSMSVEQLELESAFLEWSTSLTSVLVGHWKLCLRLVGFVIASIEATVRGRSAGLGISLGAAIQARRRFVALELRELGGMIAMITNGVQQFCERLPDPEARTRMAASYEELRAATGLGQRIFVIFGRLSDGFSQNQGCMQNLLKDLHRLAGTVRAAARVSAAWRGASILTECFPAAGVRRKSAYPRRRPMTVEVGHD